MSASSADASALSNTDIHFKRRAIALLLPTAVTASASQALIPALAGILARTDNAEEAISGFAVAFSITLLAALPHIRVQQMTLVFFDDSTSLPVIRNFVLRWSALSTLVIAVVALTPLNEIILGSVFSVEPEVERQAAGALRALVVLPGLLVVRAYMHGVALRAERPLIVWIGSITGSVIVVSIASTLILTDTVNGALAGGIAFSSGAAVEVALLWFLTRRVAVTGTGKTAVTIRDMTKFFWPLLVAAIAPSVTQPIISASMARAAEPTVSIAAVSVSFGLFQTVSAATNGVQNSTLALFALRFSEAQVLRFMLVVGLLTSVATLLIGFVPPVTSLVLEDILGTEDRLLELARFAFRLLAPLPMVLVIEQVFAARLMRVRNTKPIVIINIARLIVLVTWVTTTVNATSFTGAAVGAGAVALTLLIEGVMTFAYARRSGGFQPSVEEHPAS